jgi:hypothetical protein
MARALMTNAQLQAISIEVDELRKHSPAVSFLLKEKINRFYQQNGLQLKIIDKKKDEFAKQHCLLEASGEPMTEDKEGIKHYKFIDDEAKNKYLDAITEFMERSVYVES